MDLFRPLWGCEAIGVTTFPLNQRFVVSGDNISFGIAASYDSDASQVCIKMNREEVRKYVSWRIELLLKVTGDGILVLLSLFFLLLRFVSWSPSLSHYCLVVYYCTCTHFTAMGISVHGDWIPSIV